MDVLFSAHGVRLLIQRGDNRLGHADEAQDAEERDVLQTRDEFTDGRHIGQVGKAPGADNGEDFHLAILGMRHSRDRGAKHDLRAAGDQVDAAGRYPVARNRLDLWPAEFMLHVFGHQIGAAAKARGGVIQLARNLLGREKVWALPPGSSTQTVCSCA